VAPSRRRVDARKRVPPVVLAQFCVRASAFAKAKARTKARPSSPLACVFVDATTVEKLFTNFEEFGFLMFKHHQLEQEICLTCQYFRIPRRVEVIGSKMFIDYNASMGNCQLFQNVPRVCTCKANSVSFCHYKRWVELP